MSSTPTSNNTTAPAALPSSLAHELDVLRAARQGIDITGMAPEERCKYPGKFCCEKRVRKSTGKLHRFCQYHRSRANVNQKRWTQIRRRHEATQDVVATTVAQCAHDPWMDAAMPMLAPAGAWPMAMTMTMAMAKPLAPKPLTISAPKQDEFQFAQQSMSPTNVDSIYDDDILLSEDDIDTIMTIIADNEKAVGSEGSTVEDAWLMAMLNDIDVPAMASIDAL